MNKLFWLYLLLIALFTGGCNENSFQQVVEIEIPDHDPKLVLYAEVRAISSVENRVYASASRRIDSKLPEMNISGVEISFYQDERWVQTLPFVEKSGYFSLTNVSFTPDIVHKVVVTAPGFETVFAEQILPSIVPISKLQYFKQSFLDESGDKNDEVWVTINDPEGQTNYYALEIYHDREAWFRSGDTIVHRYDTTQSYVSSIDPIVSGDRTLLFSDETFNGKEKTVRVYYHHEEYTQVAAVLRSITREYYLFLKSFDAYLATEDNPFAEPVEVFSNVENGFGIFGLSVQDVKTKKIK